MIDIVYTISKYLIMICFGLFVIISFRVQRDVPEEMKQQTYTLQRSMMIAIHAAAFFVIALHILNGDSDINIWYLIAFYIGQLAYLLVMTILIPRFVRLNQGINHIVTGPNGIRPMRTYNKVMGFIVNVIRSMPFLILMIAVMPYIRKVIGTGIGTSATTAALIVAAWPFVARMVEQSLLEVDPGVIEAAQAMGASNMQIIWKVMLLEARSSLLNGAAVATITILGYSAMAGTLGGGGLGDIAIRYGHYRFQPTIMWITILVLIVLVQILQEIGIRTAAKLDNRIN